MSVGGLFCGSDLDWRGGRGGREVEDAFGEEVRGGNYRIG